MRNPFRQNQPAVWVIRLTLLAALLATASTVLAFRMDDPWRHHSLWGNGYVWLSNDGSSICSNNGCVSLYQLPAAPTPSPTIRHSPTPPVTPTPSPRMTPTTLPQQPQGGVVGEVPLRGQTKYVSCELRTTANNVEWYFRYRVGVDPAERMPAGYKDFEYYFIDIVGEHCNPNRGFRGSIEGRFVTVCDPAVGGYGVYPRPIEPGLAALGVPYRTVYLEVNADNAQLLRDIFAESYANNQVLSLWVRQKVDAPLEWETDPETGEVYPIGTHEHAISGRVVRNTDGILLFDVIDPWPMYDGVRYPLGFGQMIEWMGNLGVYMLQVIG